MGSAVEPASAPDVSVLVVTYNSAGDIWGCLASIEGAFVRGERVEVVVVDNASADETLAVVRSADLPAIQLVEQTTNVGFARAVNTAARRSTGRYLLLLNPDAVLHAGAGSALIDFADSEPHHGLYGGRAFTSEGELDPRSCWGLPSLWSSFCFACGLSTLFRRNIVFDPTSLGRWERDSVREVDVISGCLLLADRTCWETLGGLDERYFLYGEDVDLGHRAAEHGLRPVIVPQAAVTHAGSSSSPHLGKRTELLFTGRATYIRLRWTGVRRWFGIAMLVIGVALRSIVEQVARRPGRWTQCWSRRHVWSRGYA